MVAVGDPQQLPPTLSSQSGESQGLEKTMFLRLANAGADPVMLRTQYRCACPPPPQVRH